MTCLQAALDAGADAVYLGLDTLNMRQMATRNFSRETLPEAARRCREFLIQEVREGEGADAAFVVTPHTVLSARDLCSLPFVDRLMAAGIASFKIEGRARNPEYVKATVTAYRAAVAAVLDGTFSPALAERLTADCARVYHREFGCGLFYGRPGAADQFTDTDANQATAKKLHVGIVLNYYPKAKMAQIQIQDQPVALGDTLSIHGPTSGVVDLTVTALRRDDEVCERAGRGTWVTLPCPARVRPHDKVFVVRNASA